MPRIFSKIQLCLVLFLLNAPQIFSRIHLCRVLFLPPWLHCRALYVHILTSQWAISNMFENHSFWIAWSLEIWGYFTQNGEKNLSKSELSTLGGCSGWHRPLVLRLLFIFLLFSPSFSLDIFLENVQWKKAKNSPVSDFVANCKFCAVILSRQEIQLLNC